MISTYLAQLRTRRSISRPDMDINLARARLFPGLSLRSALSMKEWIPKSLDTARMGTRDILLRVMFVLKTITIDHGCAGYHIAGTILPRQSQLRRDDGQHSWCKMRRQAQSCVHQYYRIYITNSGVAAKPNITNRR